MCYPSIKDYIKGHAERIERELAACLPAEWQVPAVLRESMDYSLMAGGKRMRPIMVIAAAEACNGSADAALPVACAVEMVHTYSLIHDDLPALDNDDYRRGRLTNHKMFGDATAILAGDALLTHAFFAAARTARQHGISADRVLAVIEDLAEYAGPRGMVGGQVADMLGEQGLTKLEELEYIHLHKTSDLIVFSLKAGGRIGGATERQLQALETFGTNIGLAFQIQDDILDVVGDASKLGKAVRSDEKMQKVTYPYFIGLDASRQKVKELTEQGKEAIVRAEIPDPERLLQLADYLMQRDH
ncbi:polyprenyl synthetase family protein [Paenibacillus hemerocallicola]|uniref:Farnesyl diphosphate synthase n=1 Tax=Paenibacillus hemerocallicola TaxID=1172614 RepID=A0A5C4TFR6_9BACL|nr:farnesyl diphosphate synthase [Paenibacillus hemerocallicola]TNJ67340.1 polyprenyl synthetase family protein [Paenibacillus hemerocallicola]